MSFIKPISYWQNPTPSINPPVPQNIYVCGYNFYKWNGTRLGLTTAGGIAKISQTGTLDTTWTTNANPSGTNEVRFFTPLNGNIYADWRAGGAGARTFRKLDSTGTSVASVGTGTNGTIWGVSATEGKNFVMITGDKSPAISYNGTTVNGIGKVNESLVLDTTFATNIGSAGAGGLINGFVTSAFTTDDRIGVSGYFTSWNGNGTYNRFVVLNHDGTRDTGFARNSNSFNSNANSCIFIDNKWIVAGSFTTWGAVTVNRIMAFNTDGSQNTAFTTNIGSAFNNAVYQLIKVSDTQFAVATASTTLNGATIGRIALVNSDGTIPTQPFGTGFGSAVSNLAISTDGKYYASSSPPVTNYQGYSSNNLFAINSNGSIDSTFVTGSGMQNTGTTTSDVGSIYVR